VDSVNDKYITVKAQLEKEATEASKTERAVSEKTALLTRNKLQVGSLKSQIDRLSAANGSLSKVRKIVEKAKNYAEEAGVPFDANEKSPEKLLAFLDDQIEELDGKMPAQLAPDLRKQLGKRIKSLVISIMP